MTRTVILNRNGQFGGSSTGHAGMLIFVFFDNRPYAACP